MKRFSYLLLTFLLSSFIMAGCDNGGGGDKQVELPNKNESTQQAFANEQTTGGFTFTAKSAWTATVSQPSPSRAPSVEWLRLLLDGTETYSGGAGTFKLVIELDTNYTGATRSATIVIQSGSDKITITVTQQGKTEQGKVPVQKLIKKISTTSTHPMYPGNPHTTELEYDARNRVVKTINGDFDGPGTRSITTFNYESATKVTGTVTYTNSDGQGQGTFTLTLNADGYEVDSKDTYRMTGGEPQNAESSFDYTDGYLSKMTTIYDIFIDSDEDIQPDAVTGPSKDRNKEIASATWSAGNLTAVSIDYYTNLNDPSGPRLESKDLSRAQYGTYKNDGNLDLNFVIEGMAFFSAEQGINMTGKRSVNLMSKVESFGWAASAEMPSTPTETINYTYQFTDGYVTKVILDIHYTAANESPVRYTDTYTISYE